MNKETRIKKITEIYNREPYTYKEIMWEDDLESMGVFKVPLRCLIYNKYNGRILSRTKSLEAQGRDINPENEKDKDLVEGLLWDSKVDRNRKTKIDIEKYGQKEIGIITKDGIIIDGNRRAMLLNQIEKYDYFKAIILPVTLEENFIEIKKLETSYQMKEEEKLKYNAIEKYLVAKDLNKNGVSIDNISDWMGEKTSTIEDYLSIINTMDDYLDYLKYNKVYTQLDGREDQFINLTKWVNTFLKYNNGVLTETGSAKAFVGYSVDDVDALKAIAYDYIRVKFEGKKFRYLAEGLRAKHFFGNKKIWASFSDKHFSCTDPIRDQEGDPNLDSNNIQAALNSRDDDFKNDVLNFLNENLDEHYTQLRFKQNEDEPAKLVSNAKRAISSINTNSKDFKKPEVLDSLVKLSDDILGIISDKSSERTLQHIIALLSTFIISGDSDKEQLKKYLTKINKTAYQIIKEI